MTHEEWERKLLARMREYRNAGVGMLRSRDLARRDTVRQFGPEPPKPPRPPLAVRLGLRALGLVLRDVIPQEVRMSPFLKKLIVSLVYGFGALGAVVSAALADSVITSNEWMAIGTAFVLAFWGKFSSNTTVIAPAREGETITDFGPNK